MCVINLCISLFLLKRLGIAGSQVGNALWNKPFVPVGTLFFFHLEVASIDKSEKKHIWSHTDLDFMYKREKCIAICLGYLQHFSILG